MQQQHMNRGSMVGGLILIGLGLLFLLGQNFQFAFFELFENWNVPYTTYIIVTGVVFTLLGLFGGRNLTGVTIFGSITLVTGLLLAYQDATSSYQTWAYMWALVFPGSIGLGLVLEGAATHENRPLRVGLNMIVIALVITVVGWSLFEGAMNLSGYDLSGLVNFAGPLALIAVGTWMLLRPRTSQGEE
jgi:hypothetical protein